MVRLEETDRGTFAKVESVNPIRRKTKAVTEGLEEAPF